MKKMSLKKVFLATLMTMAFVAYPMTAAAFSASNGFYRINGTASRPATGAPRGSATITTLTNGSNGVRVRMSIVNHGSNTTVTQNVWTQRVMANNRDSLGSGVTSSRTAQLVGCTRSGTVRAHGARRGTTNQVNTPAAWGAAITATSSRF